MRNVECGMRIEMIYRRCALRVGSSNRPESSNLINYLANQFIQLNIFVENERSGFNRDQLTNSDFGLRIVKLRPDPMKFSNLYCAVHLVPLALRLILIGMFSILIVGS